MRLGRDSKRIRGAILLLTGLLLTAALPTQAGASGGPTIAAAPSITFNKQLFGNTAADGQSSCGGTSWWLLPVLAGDKVKIDFEGNVNALLIWPVGTTDFNIHSARQFGEADIGGNGKQEALFKAPLNGSMPIEFHSYCYDEPPGPYDFIATDRHALVASLERYVHITRTSTLTGTANLADGTPTPDGLRFTLTVTWARGKAQYSAASQGGSLSFPLTLPASARGKHVHLQITRPGGAHYQGVKSMRIRARIARGRLHRHRR